MHITLNLLCWTWETLESIFEIKADLKAGEYVRRYS